MRDLSRLVAALPGARVAGTLPPAIDALAADSRNVRPGTLFVALGGEHADGHDFAADAVARGAAALVVERALPLDVAQIVVADTRIAASALADAFYDHPSRALLVAGVTGTNGKTTTAHLIRDLFTAAGVPCAVIGTLGAEFGERTWPLDNTTPLALELHALLAGVRDAGAKAVAIEVSSHALALHRVDHVAFDVAALTNVTRDHLDFHGTIEAYAAAKRRLFDLAPYAALNADDRWGARFLHELDDPANAAPYAIDAEARGGFRATAVRLEPDGSTFRLFDEQLHVRLPGRFNVYNALAAIASASLVLDLSMDELRRGLAAARAVPGRMERIAGDGVAALVDYAHTPDALENVLRAARETAPRELIVVFGCGGDRDAGKRAPMGEIAARLADRVIVTSDNPRSEDPAAIARAIATGCARANGEARGTADVVLDRRAAIRRAISEAQAGDLVVVAGKGHEPYQIVGSERRAFDDRAEVRAALAARTSQAVGGNRDRDRGNGDERGGAA